VIVNILPDLRGPVRSAMGHLQSEIGMLFAPFPGRDRAAGPCPGFGDKEASVAKTTPLEFIRQVRAETAKVVWPTRRETVMTGVMVVIMTTMLAVFFLAIDSVFEAIVKLLLSLAQG
jgi:preprotein translocase subunit SecE